MSGSFGSTPRRSRCHNLCLETPGEERSLDVTRHFVVGERHYGLAVAKRILSQHVRLTSGTAQCISVLPRFLLSDGDPSEALQYIHNGAALSSRLLLRNSMVRLIIVKRLVRPHEG